MPSKRFQASYVGPDDNRHYATLTFTQRLDAERWLSDERRLIERDEWSPAAARAAAKKVRSVSVAECTQAWIDHRSLKPRTRNSYQALLDRHIAGSAIGTVALKDLTAEAVRSWYRDLGPGHPTINSHAYALLHAVCSTAVGDGVLVSNPVCAGVDRAVVYEPDDWPP